MASRQTNLILYGIFVMFLAGVATVMAEKRCHNISDCENGTYCCFRPMTCRPNCTAFSCASDGDCLEANCCDARRKKCSKKACHRNDDPFWKPLVYGTVVFVSLVFLGVCVYSCCYTIPCVCSRKSAGRDRSEERRRSSAGHHGGKTSKVDMGMMDDSPEICVGK